MENVISANLALPHKVFQYLACGLPVVSTKLSGIHSTLGDNSGVIWVESPKEVLGAALELLENKQSYTRQAEKASKSLLSLFNMSSVIGDFEKFISTLSEKKRA
jgi:glycosyltransferase involved in cell wall biosynthesis